MRNMAWYLQAPTGLEAHKNQWRTRSKGAMFDKAAKQVVHVKKIAPCFIPWTSFLPYQIYMFMGLKKELGNVTMGRETLP